MEEVYRTFVFSLLGVAFWPEGVIIKAEQLNRMSSGQGENHDRRYSPRAGNGRPGVTPGPTVTRIRRREVWMKEDVLKLRTS